MAPLSFPIYGSFAIQGYGVATCLGLLIGFWRGAQHPWALSIPPEQRIDMVTYATFVGIAGGRLWNVITEWHDYSLLDIFKIWEGGLSVMGAMVAVLLFIPTYLYWHRIPLFPLCDVCALYMPLIHAIARLGCLCAGCCGGIATTMPWGISYHTGTVTVHPTQLYSAGALFLIFLVMRYLLLPYFHRPGQTLGWYLVLSSMERCIIDWWRNDRILYAPESLLSINQQVALITLTIGVVILGMTFWLRQRPYEYF